MHKWVVSRSLVGSEGRHAAFQCHTGWPVAQQPPGGWPSFGSYTSKLKGAADPGIPPFVSLSPKTKAAPWGDPGQPGFLGPAHAPFTPNADGGGTLALGGISLDQLSDRRALASQLDRLKRAADATGAISGLDTFEQQAFSILTSGKLVEALDLDREDR